MPVLPYHSAATVRHPGLAALVRLGVRVGRRRMAHITQLIAIAGNDLVRAESVSVETRQIRPTDVSPSAPINAAASATAALAQPASLSPKLSHCSLEICCTMHNLYRR
jgi:hypothetical protein